MELGDVKRHLWWRNGFLTGAIVFGLVALIDAAGTTYAFVAPGYVFEDGEIPAEITVFVVASLLAVGCALLARRHGKLRAEVFSAGGSELWLPPLTERNGEGQVDLEVETARLRPLALRALAIGLAWVIVFAGAVFGFSVLAQSAERLLATGIQVPGKVLSVDHRRRGTSTISVEYKAKGELRSAKIVWDSGRQYAVGQAVTVVYAPTDPARVRTLDETNDDQTWVWVFVAGTVGSLLGIPFSAVAAVKWRRRYRAVRRTGWRIASVTVVPDYPVRKGRHMPDIHVEYRDGSRIMLRAAQSSHGSVPLKDRPDRRAWVGGTDRDMVVLFPHGRWRKPPYAVPAYATTTRS